MPLTGSDKNDGTCPTDLTSLYSGPSFLIAHTNIKRSLTSRQPIVDIVAFQVSS